MLDFVLYYLALGIVKFLEGLPLPVVAWIGRRAGSLAYVLDVRHRKVALRNLQLCFGREQSPRAVRALARENFRRIGEAYLCGVRTSGMRPEHLAKHLQFVGARKIVADSELQLPTSRIVAIGHFGNFELYARTGDFLPGFRTMTTYRGLPHPRLNRLLLELRQRSGCLLFERRVDGAALRKAMDSESFLIGFLSDQHAGRSGLWVPFFGRPCSTTAAPALFAQRYRLPLHTAICFRTGLGQWRIEIGDEIPTFENGRRRSPAAVMTDVNAALELAIRRDPANWFWVHTRWRTPKCRTVANPVESQPEAEPA